MMIFAAKLPVLAVTFSQEASIVLKLTHWYADNNYYNY